MGLKGDLKSFALPELFQSLAINQHTGLLAIQNEKNSIGIFFTYGEITAVSLGSKRVLKLGELLVRKKKITPEKIQEALAIQRNMEGTRDPLGKILIERDWVNKDDIEAIHKEKVEEGIYDVFFWEEANFEFLRDVTVTKAPPDFQNPFETHIDAPSLVMEAMSRLDNWDQYKARISDFDKLFVFDRSKVKELQEIQSEVHFDLTHFDGRNTLEQIQAKNPVTMYELIEDTVALLGKGLLRELTFQELVGLGKEKMASKDLEGALKYYRNAVYMEPKRPDIRFALAHILEAQDDPSTKDQWMEASKLYFQEQNYEKCKKGCEKVLARDPHHLPALELLYQTCGNLQDSAVQMEIGLKLGESWQSRKEFERAQTLYQNMIKLFPKEVVLKKKLGEVFLSMGDQNKAGKLFEATGLAIEEEGKLEEALQLYQEILEIDPDRGFIIKKIEELEKKIRKRNLIRKVSIGAVLVLTILATILVIHVRNEAEKQHLEDAKKVLKKAKEQMAKVENNIALKYVESPSFKTIDGLNKTLLQLRGSYYDTPSGEQAQQMLNYLNDQLLPQYNKIIENKARETKLALAEKDFFEETKKNMSKAKKNKEYRKMYDLGMEFFKRYPKSLRKDELRFPLLIRTIPSKATVTINRQSSRRTQPHKKLVSFYRFPKNIEVTVEKRGYEAKNLTLKPDQFHDLEILLQRKPLWMYPRKEDRPLGSLEHLPLIRQDSLYFISRDGNLYALKFDESLSVLKPLWSAQITTPGDTISNPVRIDEKYLLLGTSDRILYITLRQGVVLSFFPSTQFKSSPSQNRVVANPWRFTNLQLVGSTPFICAANTNHHFYALYLKQDNFNIIGTVPTLAPLRGGIASRQNTVFFGGTDNRVYAVDLTSFYPKKLWTYLISGKVVTTPIVGDNTLTVATTDGRVSVLQPTTGKLLWSNKKTPIAGGVYKDGVEESGKIYYGSDRGYIYTIDPEKKVQTKLSRHFGQITTSLVATRGVLYFGAGRNFYVYDLFKNKILWSYNFPQKIVAPPLVTGRYIYIPCTNGRLYCFLR